MENKKDILKTVLIIVLICVIVGIFTVPQYLDKQYQEGYSAGINETIIQLATQQTQSGNMLIVYNNSLQAFPLATLCQGVQG